MPFAGLPLLVRPLLIELYGIETQNNSYAASINSLLIELYGIETAA